MEARYVPCVVLENELGRYDAFFHHLLYFVGYFEFVVKEFGEEYFAEETVNLCSLVGIDVVRFSELPDL
jgi:hypothetical protein